MSAKACTKCGSRKPREGFYADERTTDRLQSQCKACHNAARRARYAADPNSRAQARINSQRWALANPVRGREIRRKHNWAKQGIDPRQAADLLSQHNGICALCGADSPRAKTGWHVDHDHRTGKVRDILCHRCNVGLGAFGDDDELMRKAAEYVTRHRVSS